MEIFELYLSPIDKKRFRAIVTQSGGVGSSLPFFDDETDWRMTLLRILEIASFDSKYFSPGEQEWMKSVSILAQDGKDFENNYLVNIGQALYRSLFPTGKVEDAFKAALRLAEGKNTQLHIQLRFDDDSSKYSRLADYPWELLHDGQRFLLHHQVTFSRYIAHGTLPPNLPLVEKLNVLLISSAAFDKELGLKKLSKKEQQAIYKGLKSASEAGDINLQQLNYATVDELREYLTEHKGNNTPRVVHFDGHGIFGKRCQNKNCLTIHQKISATHCSRCNKKLSEAQGYLAFEGETDKPDYVSAKELGALLQISGFADGSQKSGGVALVVLSACQSAMALEGESVFNGTAQNLINHRIPAVVAMQYSVGVDAATEFSKQFYRSLGQKNSLATSISKGREAMDVEGNQWYRPVLYLRWQDNEGGRLFEPESKSTISPDIPFQVPPLPNYYVERPEYSNELKKRLLKKSDSNSTLVITAIHGLGSVGKSTLAAAVAHDPKIKAHYCDGILWATLGQKPNVLSFLAGWVQELGDYEFRVTSIEATSAHLRRLLEKRTVLLVVDDAWNSADVEAFNVGGSKCQMLVTTREAIIAEALRASTYSLDVMKSEQAIELLAKKLGRKLDEEEYQEAESLAKALGYLPLALELSAAQVANNISWSVLLEDFEKEVARLKTLDRPGAREITDEATLKRLSLSASLNLSIRRLREEQRHNFIWLGILPEDITITSAMMKTLWDMNDERDVEYELQNFKSKALLLPGVSIDKTPTYRLHDLFHDLARNLLEAPIKPSRTGDLSGLGISFMDAHAKLLEKYRKKTKNGLWHTLPQDGYIQENLVWHLEKANWIEEIHKLLQEETSDRDGNKINAWYEVKEQLGQVASYLTDVIRAWELAEANWDKASLPKVVGLQYRYALVIASINSFAAILPEKMFFELIKKNIWTPEEALFYALRIPESSQKVKRLIFLTDYLSEDLKEKALKEVKAIGYPSQDELNYSNQNYNYTYLINELLRFLEIKGIKGNFVSELGKFKNKQSESEILDFFKKLNTDYRAIIYLLYRTIDKVIKTEEKEKISQLDFLKKLLPDIQRKLYKKIFPEIKEIQSVEIRALILICLADELPEISEGAFSYATNIHDIKCRIQLIDILADKLPPDLLLEALKSIRYIQDEEYCFQSLGTLASKHSQLLLDKSVVEISTENDEPDIQAIEDIAEKRSMLLLEALSSSENNWDNKIRIKALIALSDKLPSNILSKAIQILWNITDKELYAQELIGLIEKKTQFLPEVFKALSNLQSEKIQIQALVALADKLPPSLLSEVLKILKSIPNKKFRVQALVTLADKNTKLLSEALEEIKKIENEEFRVQALVTLADKNKEFLPEALEEIKKIENEEFRVQTLLFLFDKQPQLFSEVLQALETINDNHVLIRALVILRLLLDQMSSDLLQEALEVTSKIDIDNEEFRIQAQYILNDKLSSDLLQEALEVTSKIDIDNEEFYIKVIIALANNIKSEIFLVLSENNNIFSFSKKIYKVLALQLAKQLPTQLLLEAYKKINQPRYFRSTEDELYDQVIVALAVNINNSLLEEYVKTLKYTSDIEFRVLALTIVSDKLSHNLFRSALYELVDELDSQSTDDEDEEFFFKSLANKLMFKPDKSNKLPSHLLSIALKGAMRIWDEEFRIQTLVFLVEKQPQLLTEILDDLSRIRNDEFHLDNSISDKEFRIELLTLLANKISENQVFRLWKNNLHDLSQGTRPNLLQNIKLWTSIIYTLGGKAAISETFHAVEDVTRWWR